MLTMETENLVSFSRGNTPIQIIAAHGGSKNPEDIELPRVESKGYKTRDIETFSIQGDENTYEVALRLAEKLKEKIGLQPYLVLAEFDRKYIDANRNNALMGTAEKAHENHSYDDPAGQKYYDQYHNKIRQYIADIRHQFKGEGLLLDIHGTVFQDNKIVVGMVTYDPSDFQRYFRRGHVSVDKLLERFGSDPLYHPYSGFMSAMHKRDLPGGFQTEAVPLDRFERASPAGGYCVTNYGSNRPKGINAFHLDCSRKLRTVWLDSLTDIFSDAVHTLYRNVLEDPYTLETAFAGRKEVGQCSNLKDIESAYFEFSVHNSPQKDYPVLIMIHTRKSANIPPNATVTLNDHCIGNLKPDKPVSVFEIENKGWGKLSKKKNILTVCLTKSNNTREEKSSVFEITKVSVIYGCATW
jgi:hypothetical protein